MSTILQSKYGELMPYIERMCRRWQLDSVSTEDVQQEVMVKLLEENEVKEFTNARELWGRATIHARESIAACFAASLPVSGISHQVHNAARRHLEANNNDPQTAYKNQIPTLAKVSRNVLDIVAGGSGLREPAVLAREDHEPSEPYYGLTEQEEASIMAAVNSLPEIERNVVRAYVWGDGERLTLRQVAHKLGYSVSATRSAWNRARRRLSIELRA